VGASEAAIKRPIYKEISMSQYTGIVKWWSSEKSYGFIISDVHGKDIFIHKTDLKKSGMDALVEGQRVTFDTQEKNGKTSACNVGIV